MQSLNSLAMLLTAETSCSVVVNFPVFLKCISDKKILNAFKLIIQALLLLFFISYVYKQAH